MKQAKQQAQDLRQTDTFLGTLMKPGQPEKEKVKNSENQHPRQVNGRPKMPRVDSFSRFSDPPAPPPQQPLPEKPDALPRNGTDAISPLKRSETEKAKLGAGNSPVARDSSQILSLIEALTSTRRELDSQGARVKELENLLLHERAARESAEERARKMEMHTAAGSDDSDSTVTIEPYLGDTQNITNGLPVVLEKSFEKENGSAFDDNAKASEDGQAKQLQRRLEEVMSEMEEMRSQVVTLKDRAHKAESETAETRKSLAEMIETLRRERAENADRATKKPESLLPDPTETVPEIKGSISEVKEPESFKSPKTKETPDGSAPFTPQQQKQAALEQSSPYASMLGVVLLGVGIMAYLNGWQRMDR